MNATPGVSILQVISLANHPRVWQKINDPKGQVARIVKEFSDDKARIEELYLATLSRLPDEAEQEACLKYLRESRVARRRGCKECYGPC